MNAFARTDGKVKFTMRANLQIFVQLLVENHCLALRAFSPKSLRDIPFFGFLGAEFGLFGKVGLRVIGQRRGQRRLGFFEIERFFCESSRGH